MNFRFLFLPIFVVLALFTSCDYVDDPTEDTNTGGGGGGGGPDTTLAMKRDILLMDFTGHQCSNCPNAAVTAEGIYEDYPEQVTVLAVHPDLQGLSTPVDGDPGDPFVTDFRTPIGIQLQNQYDIQFMPIGVVSGMEIDGSYWMSVGNWRSTVESVIDDPKIAEIDITLDYDSTSRSLNISTSTETIEEWDGMYTLSVVMVEDSVVDWQKNGTGGQPSDPNYPYGNIPDYVHRHVLRGAVNGTGGTGLVTTDQITSPGLTFDEDFSHSVSEEYDHSHMYVYAYVYNANTYEIIDVSHAKLIE
jgi:hypothetical protein